MRVCVCVCVWSPDAPVIRCFSSSAFVGDRNAFLRCDIRARPWVTALYWILDLNGTTIGKSDSVSDYWTKVMVLHSTPSLIPHYILRES